MWHCQLSQRAWRGAPAEWWVASKEPFDWPHLASGSGGGDGDARGKQGTRKIGPARSYNGDQVSSPVYTSLRSCGGAYEAER
jgi:hypothetical protein